MGRGRRGSLPFSLSPSPLPLPFLRLPRWLNHPYVGHPGNSYIVTCMAITDLCVGIVLEPTAVIYIGFPFSTKDRIVAILCCRNSWENEYKALGSVISGIVRLGEQAIVMVMNGCWYLRQPLASHK